MVSIVIDTLPQVTQIDLFGPPKVRHSDYTLYMFPPFFATPTERHDAQVDANLHHLKLHLSPHIQAEENRQALIDKQNTKLLQRIVDIMTSKKKSFPVAETRRKVRVGHRSALINM